MPCTELVPVASAQDDGAYQGWDAPAGDAPEAVYPDEDPGQYDLDGLAPEDLPADDGAFDEAPGQLDWQDEAPPQE